MMFGHLGREFSSDPRLNAAYRLYIAVFGIPISGLRIRLRRVMPLIQGDFREIADMGCGKGIFSFELARRFPSSTVYGIDTDAEQIEINQAIVQKHGIRNLRFECVDILNTNFDGRFDLVLSVDNLEHVEDHAGAVRLLHRSLKPSGKLVCHVPSLERIWVFSGHATNFNVPGHVRPGYSPEQLRELLQASGFKVESLGTSWGYLETVSNNLSYKITGASQSNKGLYALAFPILNAAAWLGQFQKQHRYSAGVYAVATKSKREIACPPPPSKSNKPLP
jgi:SAM-dependent methyltransferase